MNYREEKPFANCFKKEYLDGKNLIAYPLIEGQRIKYQN